MHIAAGVEESVRDQFLRGIPTKVVGFTPLLIGSAYLIVYKELINSYFWRANGVITSGELACTLHLSGEFQKEI